MFCIKLPTLTAALLVVNSKKHSLGSGQLSDHEMCNCQSRAIHPNHKSFPNLQWYDFAEDRFSRFHNLKRVIDAILRHLGLVNQPCKNNVLTHWGRVTHICVGNLTIIGSDNGLSPGRRQAIIWTNAGILLIGPLETNFSEIWIAIETFSLRKMHLKMASGKWRPFCLGLNVLTT